MTNRTLHLNETPATCPVAADGIHTDDGNDHCTDCMGFIGD